MQNAKLNESQAGIKISGININNLRYADDTTLTESFGLLGDPTSPSSRKSVLNIHWKD